MKRFEVELVVNGKETTAFIQAETRQDLFQNIAYQYGSDFQVADIKENEKGTLN